MTKDFSPGPDPLVSLDTLRASISACDREIVAALHRRAAAAREIGRLKHAGGAPFYDPTRQRQVIENAATAQPDGEFPTAGLHRVFEEIMSACLSLERPLTVGYLGPPGTFSHEAARKAFGSAPDLRPMVLPSDVVSAVDRGVIDYGILPIENSTGGMVNTTLDLFMEMTSTLVAEHLLHVRQCLVAGKDAKLSVLRRLYSHPQGFAQCGTWLKRHLPDVARIETSSTAEGVARALADGPTAAAIAGPQSAVELNAEVLEKGIEDRADNTTRFLVIGRHPARPSGHDLTSMMLGLPDKPGALTDLLTLLSQAGVNLTKIDSRPSRRRSWDYVFFLDVEGHVGESPLREVMLRLHEHCGFLKVLGSYPRALSPGMPS